jgi:hypothetical protein
LSLAWRSQLCSRLGSCSWRRRSRTSGMLDWRLLTRCCVVTSPTVTAHEAHMKMPATCVAGIVFIKPLNCECSCTDCPRRGSGSAADAFEAGVEQRFQ